MTNYFLSSYRYLSTGLIQTPDSATHARCGGTIAPHSPQQGPWACTECQQVGWLQHMPTFIAQRQRDLPRPFGPEPPSDRHVWQQYVDGYFAQGVLMVGANDDAEFSVREDSVLGMSDKVHVERFEDDTHLVVFNILTREPHRMHHIRGLRQVAPGVLVVKRDELNPIRLQTHVLGVERRHVKSLREWPQLEDF